MTVKISGLHKSPAQMPKKTFGKHRESLTTLPNLVENQLLSYKNLIEKDMPEIFKEFNPISDYTGKKFDLDFLSFEISEPKYDEVYAKDNKLTYEAPMRAKVRLHNKVLNTTKEQEIFMSDFPMMTVHGTFIVNGVERVVVPQLARSFGVFFDTEEIKGRRYFGAKIVPNRGVWTEILSEADNNIIVRIDKKRKFGIVPLLRAFGYATDDQIIKAFVGDNAKSIVKELLEKDAIKNTHDAYIEIYKKLRDGDMATAENAKEYFDTLFSAQRYDLSPVGRFGFNKRFNMPTTGKESDRRTLSKEDIVKIIEHIIDLNADPESIEDDIDHLGSRRVRFVGEMMAAKIRVGMTQNVCDRYRYDSSYHYSESASITSSYKRILYDKSTFTVHESGEPSR